LKGPEADKSSFKSTSTEIGAKNPIPMPFPGQVYPLHFSQTVYIIIKIVLLKKKNTKKQSIVEISTENQQLSFVFTHN
jgi:hypothetical protein